MAHSLYSPSSSQRAIECPASVGLTKDLPDTQSVYSAEGTAAHHVGELCLKNACNTDRYAGCHVVVNQKGDCKFQTEFTVIKDDEFVFEVDDEMCTAIQEYVDWCRELVGEHFVEVRVDVSKYTPIPEQFGTCDHACVRGRTLTITDLKYGKGVRVDAEGNTQLLLYALGMFDWLDDIYDFDEIVIRVCQPRLDHKDVWVLTRDELIEWGDKIRAGLLRTVEPNPPFGPSDKACKFCKIAGRCRALEEHLYKVRAFMFDDIEGEFVVDTALLTVEELSIAWHMLPLFEIRKTALLAEITNAMLVDRTEVPGCKIVESRTNRTWNDRDDARNHLLSLGLKRDQIIQEKLISPAQAEKLLPKPKRETLSDLVFKAPGGPTVVDAKDRRPLYRGVAAQHHAELFDDLDADDGLS
jgi:hypothetical protein